MDSEGVDGGHPTPGRPRPYDVLLASRSLASKTRYFHPSASSSLPSSLLFLFSSSLSSSFHCLFILLHLLPFSFFSSLHLSSPLLLFLFVSSISSHYPSFFFLVLLFSYSFSFSLPLLLCSALREMYMFLCDALCVCIYVL